MDAAALHAIPDTRGDPEVHVMTMERVMQFRSVLQRMPDARRSVSPSDPRAAMVRSEAKVNGHEGPAVVVPIGEIIAHRRIVRRTLIRCDIPSPELGDLEQIVYFAAFQAMRAGRFFPGRHPLEGAIPAWLVGIAWRSAMTYHASPQRRDIPSGVVVVEESAEVPHPEARLEARDTLRQLAALPAKRRLALIAVGLGERPRDVATWMSVSRITVSCWLRDGRQELADADEGAWTRLSNTAAQWVIRWVVPCAGEAEARRLLPAMIRRDGCLGGRALPAAGGDPWRVQVFFPERSGPLRQGERRCLLLPEHRARLLGR